MRQFAVIGLGRFGASVAKTLAEKGQGVLGIDAIEEKVQDISEFITQAVCIDARDEKALRAVGIDNVDVAVVSIGGNLEASILITLILKEIGIKEVIAKAVSSDHGKVLQRVGATRVVFPERDMGVRLANSLLSPTIIEHIELSSNASVVEVVPPSDFVGKSLGDINIRAKYGVNVIAIKRNVPIVTKDGKKEFEQRMDVSPKADDIIYKDDVLVVLGENKNIEKLQAKKH
jgi:trk system potassium uptake protein TrkA